MEEHALGYPVRIIAVHVTDAMWDKTASNVSIIFVDLGLNNNKNVQKWDLNLQCNQNKIPFTLEVTIPTTCP